MLSRAMLTGLLFAAFMLALAACGVEEVPPCTPAPGSSVDPCEPGVELPLLPGSAESIRLGDEPRGVRDMLDGRTLPFVPHLVLRGMYLPGTVRCTAGNRFRPHSYENTDDLGVFLLNSLSFHCYADVMVNAYVIGSGPTTLTVQTGWQIYWNGYFAGVAANYDLTEAELIEEMRQGHETLLMQGYPDYDYYYETGILRPTGGIVGREVVLFIGPPDNLSSEAWLVMETWDVQRLDGGTVVAVHPGRDNWRRLRPDGYQTHRAALEMELPAFTQAVTTANQARVNEYGGRIGADTSLPMLVTNVDQLRQFMTAVGAYDHPDGPPAQPPPPCGLAVPDQGDNPGLMRDCQALLAAKDALAGTAALNWSVERSIGSWDGVKVTGLPGRVTQLRLVSQDLTGTIPPSLADLPLARLFLNGNRLTGPIPPELGHLSNLLELRLNGNALTGAIPGELGGLSNLRELWLAKNTLMGAIPSELGRLGELRQLNLSNNALTGAIPPALIRLGNLTKLRLGGNELNGCVPPALRSIRSNDLRRLGLPDCAP